ncbi:hypothetical protein L6452_47028 [Arctium lappa]|nr:hypothetical protein L6452_47028 [Arctium lappa]
MGIVLQGGPHDSSVARAWANDTCLWGPRPLLLVGKQAAGTRVASSPDSDLEAFSHNPAHAQQGLLSPADSAKPAPEEAVPKSVPRPGDAATSLSPRKQLEQSADSRRVRDWDPRAQPSEPILFPGYGSILPTSLAYIVPSTRGCSPWRPDAVMRYDRAWEALGPTWIFKGRRGAHRTPRDVRCSSSRWTLPPTESIPGWAGC